MEKFFKLKENGTTIKTELNAGFTTFLTMLYIIPVNALIMSDAGMPKEALITATALITFLASVFNGFWANTPIAMSVGMGLNTYFTYGLCMNMGLSWQTALGVVFLSGVVFLALSFTKFRISVIKAIPIDLRKAISAGIGTFICFVGLQQMGMVVANEAVLVGIGNFKDPNVLIGVLGLFLIILSWIYRVKGGFIIAIGATSLVAWFFGLSPMPTHFFSMPASIKPIFLELDIKGAFSLALIPVIITFFVTDLFDTLGTLAGVGNRANLFDENNPEKMKKVVKTLEADAVATSVGALIGVSTTTSFVESASGVEAGGRTGLTAVFTGLFFILTIFALPLFLAIPPNAIYPVLIMIGILMFSEVGTINFKDDAICVASFFMIIFIPLTYSITNGLSFGFIAYVLIKFLKKEHKDINYGIVMLGIISLIVFVLK